MSCRKCYHHHQELPKIRKMPITIIIFRQSRFVRVLCGFLVWVFKVRGQISSSVSMLMLRCWQLRRSLWMWPLRRLMPPWTRWMTPRDSGLWTAWWWWWTAGWSPQSPGSWGRWSECCCTSRTRRRSCWPRCSLMSWWRCSSQLKTNVEKDFTLDQIKTLTQRCIWYQVCTRCDGS